MGVRSRAATVIAGPTSGGARRSLSLPSAQRRSVVAKTLAELSLAPRIVPFWSAIAVSGCYLFKPKATLNGRFERSRSVLASGQGRAARLFQWRGALPANFAGTSVPLMHPHRGRPRQVDQTRRATRYDIDGHKRISCGHYQEACRARFAARDRHGLRPLRPIADEGLKSGTVGLGCGRPLRAAKPKPGECGRSSRGAPPANRVRRSCGHSA